MTFGLSKNKLKTEEISPSLFEHPTQASRLRRMFPEEYLIYTILRANIEAGQRTILLDRKYRERNNA